MNPFRKYPLYHPHIIVLPANSFIPLGLQNVDGVPSTNPAISPLFLSNPEPYTLEPKIVSQVQLNGDAAWSVTVPTSIDEADVADGPVIPDVSVK